MQTRQALKRLKACHLGNQRVAQPRPIGQDAQARRVRVGEADDGATCPGQKFVHRAGGVVVAAVEDERVPERRQVKLVDEQEGFEVFHYQAGVVVLRIQVGLVHPVIHFREHIASPSGGDQVATQRGDRKLLCQFGIGGPLFMVGDLRGFGAVAGQFSFGGVEAAAGNQQRAPLLVVAAGDADFVAVHAADGIFRNQLPPGSGCADFGRLVFYRGGNNPYLVFVQRGQITTSSA